MLAYDVLLQAYTHIHRCLQVVVQNRRCALVVPHLKMMQSLCRWCFSEQQVGFGPSELGKMSQDFNF
jgi:hypothetical protein